MKKSTRERWEAHFRNALKQNPLQGVRALLAYNSVIDKVRPLDQALLGQLRPPEEVPQIFAQAAENRSDLAKGLCYSVSNGLALEVICSGRVIQFLEEAGGYEAKPGGQVVTVARLLSDFGADSILVHPDRFNWEVASLYQGSRVRVPLAMAGRVEAVSASDLFWSCKPEIHYILEYPQGLSFGGPPAPRANRFIAAPRSSILFHREWEKALPDASRNSDVFFLAGLNHMGEEYQENYLKVREHIRIARAANPSLIVHLEITSTPDLRKRTAILEEIIPMVDSVGVNEAELADLAFLLDHPSWEEVRQNPYQQVEAMGLLRALGPRRVNLHTMGYYLTLSPNPTKEVRRSLLFAALVGGARAMLGQSPSPTELPPVLRVPIAEDGLRALDALAKGFALRGSEARTLLENGWLEDDGLVTIPTRLVPRPKYTVGLGDTISGAAIFGERWSGDRPHD